MVADKIHPRAVLFGGGVAGKATVRWLHAARPDCLAALVWDHQQGEPPELEGVPLREPEEANAEGDVLICAGFGRRIPVRNLQAFPLGSFNAHPSLLPKYRGRHAVQWALARGERELGVTVHRMTEMLDHGPPVLRARVGFGPGWTAERVMAELAEMAGMLLVGLLRMLAAAGSVMDLEDPGPGRYWPPRVPGDNRLDFSRDTRAVVGRLRAAGPGHPAYALRRNGERVEVRGWMAGNTPGEVLLWDQAGCLVATGDGVVWLEPDCKLEPGEVLDGKAKD